MPLPVRSGQDLLVPGGTQLHLGAVAHGCTGALYAPSPDRKWVAYVVGDNDLRIVEISSRQAYDLGSGCAPVWGAGGLAYLANASHTDAALRVRRDPLGTAVTWAVGEATPVAWAGSRLLYDEDGQGTDGTEAVLHLADRPGHAGTVRPAAGPVSLVAVSPDAARLLVRVDETVDGYTESHLFLLTTVTLEVLADTAEGRGDEAPSQGVWTGSTVIAANGYVKGGTAHPGPVVFRIAVTSRTVTITQQRDVASDIPAEEQPGIGLVSALEQGRSAVTVINHFAQGRLLVCRNSDLSCRQVTTLDEG